MDFLTQLIEYVKVHPYVGITIVVLIVVSLILLYVFRGTKQVIDIVGKVIIEVETSCNTEKGQQKLDMAVTKIRERLPKFISIFITKSMLVSIIEFMLNILGKAFSLEKQIDIKGNE